MCGARLNLNAGPGPSLVSLGGPPNRSDAMSSTLHIVQRSAAALLLLASAAVPGACGGSSADGGGELPTYWDAPDFELVTQHRDTLSVRDLAGTVWVGHIFFTNCTGVCPMTTGRMAQVRDSLSAAGLLGKQVRLVSISVDPARDSVPVLRNWADRHGAASPQTWAFLTGDRPDRIRSLIQEGLKLSARMPRDSAADENYQVGHSPRVLLVDRQGRVRGTYPILEPRAPGEIMADIRRLIG